MVVLQNTKLRAPNTAWLAKCVAYFSVSEYPKNALDF